MDSAAAPCFKMGKQIGLDLTLVNQTKRTTLTEKIQLIELEPFGVSLELPVGVCSQGHAVMLKVRTRGLPAEVEMEIPAKVAQQSFDSKKTTTESIVLRFGKFDDKAWGKICMLFEGRQEDLLRVFKALKE